MELLWGRKRLLTSLDVRIEVNAVFIAGKSRSLAMLLLVMGGEPHLHLGISFLDRNFVGSKQHFQFLASQNNQHRVIRMHIWAWSSLLSSSLILGPSDFYPSTEAVGKGTIFENGSSSKTTPGSLGKYF